MFTALDGGPLTPDYLTQTFTQLVRASGLPPVRLHDLRHGAASLVLAAGVDLKLVADQLGHCSIVLTADTYVSVALELALSAAEAVARLVLRAGSRPPGGEMRRPAPRPRLSSSQPDTEGDHLARRGMPHPAPYAADLRTRTTSTRRHSRASSMRLRKPNRRPLVLDSGWSTPGPPWSHRPCEK